MATVGEAATISGVLPFGFPKISSWLGRIFSPTFFALAAWSIRAKTVIPFAWTTATS